MLMKNLKPRWSSPSLFPYSDGPEVRDFISSYCLNVKDSFAARAGDPIELRVWQAALIDDLFETDAKGKRRYRRGLIGLPKKNGKSLLGSCLALNALVGDAEGGAEVYSVAAAKDQAKIVFGATKEMATKHEALARELKFFRDAIEFPLTGGVYRVLSADADLQDGLNPSFVIFDEVHRQPDGELWTVMSNAIGTRQTAMVLGITTAGHDRNSICFKLYEHGTRVSTNEVDDPEFFFRWWEPDDKDAPYDDPETWFACNPGLGDYLSEADMAAACRSTPENAFRRFRLNQWTATHSAWLKFGVWDSLHNSERALQDKEAVVLGFDGSWSNDSTALVACSIAAPHHIEVVAAWEKPLEADDWRVPVAEVEQAIRDAYKRFRVSEVVCDPASWKQSIQKLADEGYPMVEHPNTPVRMVEATKMFEDAVYEGRITHNGDAALARHINNCVIKSDRRSDGHYVTKEHRSSSRKIDLAIASIMAFSRASVQKAKKAPTIYVLD